MENVAVVKTHQRGASTPSVLPIVYPRYKSNSLHSPVAARCCSRIASFCKMQLPCDPHISKRPGGKSGRKTFLIDRCTLLRGGATCRHGHFPILARGLGLVCVVAPCRGGEMGCSSSVCGRGRTQAPQGDGRTRRRNSRPTTPPTVHVSVATVWLAATGCSPAVQ